MRDLVLYDRMGEPVAYSEDGVHLYLFAGKPVAYFHAGSVYAYSGVHLGRWDEGWIRDNAGRCVFFTVQAVGGPPRPVRGYCPEKGRRGVRPATCLRQVRRTGASTAEWSALSAEEFFER